MFKSVFVKYISAFLVINLLSIFLSTSVITTLVNFYDDEAKTRALTNIAYDSTKFMAEDFASSESNTFAEYLEKSPQKLIPILSAMSTNVDNIVIFVSDSEGNIKIVGGSEGSDTMSGGDGVIGVGEEIKYPDSVVDMLKAGDSYSTASDLDGLFSDKYRIFMQPIATREGRILGSVMACSMSSGMDVLLEAMIKTIIMSTLWLMLATLIAVYFITERLVSPLRAMSRAAREFALGHFDVRVIVTGNDEVAELAVAFNNMAATLQNSEETRRMFLANVSHDLRTPMTTISGFIESILDGAIPPDKVPHYLDVISSEIKRLSRLVSSLMNITKLQAGERKFSRDKFDICEMAREIIISSEQRLQEKKLDVEFDADRDNIIVSADRDAIHQVLYNICDNGIKFSREGGKYIVSVKEVGQKVEVGVYNEGEGISRDDLPYLFDRFYKSDRSRGLDKTGVGLGLYITKTIIDAHEEKIKVESEHGKWCKFTFTLPRTTLSKKLTKKKTDKT